MRGDVAASLGHSEDQLCFPEQAQRVQHSVPADSVLLLQVRHGRQRSRPPLASFDAPAQDRLQLAVRRNGQTGINRVSSTHQINLDHARPALTSTYIYVDLICSALIR
jgi:hypothetical protein